MIRLVQAIAARSIKSTELIGSVAIVSSSICLSCSAENIFMSSIEIRL
jgi:hypothetical protein